MSLGSCCENRFHGEIHLLKQGVGQNTTPQNQDNGLEGIGVNHRFQPTKGGVDSSKKSQR